MDPIYDELNKAWKSTCKIVLGDEIGDLKDYEDWLGAYVPQVKTRKSHISGKTVHFLFDDYCDSRFISNDESKERKIEPLNINEIKDIDSITDALSEKWEYAGDRILGNSSNTAGSDIVVDSHYVKNASYIYKSDHIFRSAGPRNCKNLFGGIGGNSSEFLIHFYGVANVRRCFEVSYITDSSDLVFCMHCVGCNDLLFSFNQKNKRNMIGNLQLPKEKYLSLKAKLLAEVREDLNKTKNFPSFLTVASDSPNPEGVEIPSAPEESFDITPLEKAFSSTYKVLFGKDPVGKIDDYSTWLSRHSGEPSEATSIFGNKFFIPNTQDFKEFYSTVSRKRMVRQTEAEELSKLHLGDGDIESLSSILNKIGKIAYYCTDIHVGQAQNISKSGATYSSSNIYKSSVAINSEYSGINSAIGKNAKHVFGCSRIVDSQFVMHGYYSSNLNRCLDVDTSTNCTGSYFCHNSEGLQDALFCYNLKGKRHIIGNTELPPDKFRTVKDSVIQQLADELDKTKDLKLDIFNIGCGAK